MNRRQRRERVWLDSLRGHLWRGGCADCHAHWTVGMDDDGAYALHVFHAETCPAAAGHVTWRPTQAVKR